MVELKYKECLNHGLFGLKDYTEKNFKMVELKYKDIAEKTKDSSFKWNL
jgi:hypothetical protein